jgi:hypothetical protein
MQFGVNLPPKMLEDVFGVDVELNRGVLLGAARNVLEVLCPKRDFGLGVSAFSSSELRLTGVPSGLVIRLNRLLAAFGSVSKSAWLFLARFFSCSVKSSSDDSAASEVAVEVFK